MKKYLLVLALISCSSLESPEPEAPTKAPALPVEAPRIPVNPVSDLTDVADLAEVQDGGASCKLCIGGESSSCEIGEVCNALGCCVSNDAGD